MLPAHMVLHHNYLQDVTGLRVLICGPQPPPRGGIAQHCLRAAHLLRTQGNQVALYNYLVHTGRGRRLMGLAWALLRRPQLVYYHTLYHGIGEWLVVCLLQRIFRYRLVVVEHSTRYVAQCSALFKRAIIWGVRYAVSQQIFIGQTNLYTYQVHTLPVRAHALLASAFLPPLPEEYTPVSALFASFRARFDQVMLINGSACVWHGTQDLYGFDVAVRLLARLIRKYPRCGLVIMVGTRGDEALYDYIWTLVRQYGLEKHVLWLEGESLVPVLSQVHLFLRPTVRDGYAISIEEAIAAGVPVIASAVAERPQEVLLYTVGDDDELFVLVTRLFGGVVSGRNEKPEKCEPYRDESKICDTHSHL